MLIVGLYLWSTSSGISNPASEFYVSPLAAAISVGSAILAGLSYFVAPEKFKSSTLYAAYWILLFAIATLILTTGSTSSPFIAIWMIATIFAGIFGPMTLVLLFVSLNIYFLYTITQNETNNEIIMGYILAGELPILVSYILWHGKSNTDKTKERAYYDLANELNQVSNKSEVVINAISDGVIAISNQGTIELINPAAQRIVGWGHQDALNLDYKSVLQLLNKNNRELDRSDDPVFAVLSTNQPIHRNDLQLQTNSGKKITVDVVVSPIGRLGSGAIIVFRDVTKEQAEGKAQAEFISTASHEMRTPVASIEGYLGLALNPATSTIDAKARDFITKAHESAQHLGRLFQDLLDVTKADDGRLSNNPKVVEIVEYTNTIVEGLRAKADEKNLRLFFKPSTDITASHTVNPVYYVDLDADHLREVLANLVENAIKYTPKGEVIVDIKGDDSHVVVSIQDSGIGIPAEDIPHLFQKFYRVDNSDTREIGGTGLGLYLCRRLVEAMGGRIWVDSEYKKGSTFSVELPRISYEEAQRLIEASGSENISTSGTQTYLNNDPEGPTAIERAQAISTPITFNNLSRVESTEEPIDPRNTTQNVDPLLMNTATTVEQPVPQKPAIKPIEAKVQTAPVAMTPAPSVQVVQTPVAQPQPLPATQQAVQIPATPVPAVTPAQAQPTAPIQPTVITAKTGQPLAIPDK